MKRSLVLLLILGPFISILGTFLINYIFITFLGFSYTAIFLDTLLYTAISYWLFRYTTLNKLRVLIVIIACTPFWLVILIDLYEYFYFYVRHDVLTSLIRCFIVIGLTFILLYLIEYKKRIFTFFSIMMFFVLLLYNFIQSKQEFRHSIETHPSLNTYHSISNIYRDSVFTTNKDNVSRLESIRTKKHIVLTFSSYVCSPCIRLKRNLLSLSPESIDSALVVNVLTVKDSSTYVKYIERYPNVDDRYITILDSDSALYKSFKIEYFPQTYLVDKQGNIAWWFAGFSKNDNLWFADELKRRIAALPD